MDRKCSHSSYRHYKRLWKCGKSNLRLLNFNSGNIINIHQKVIHEIANYLLKNPLLLTKFLECHAISIMDSLLQITKYTPAPSYFETLSKEYFESYLDGHYRNVNEPAIAEDLYKKRNFESKS